MSVRALFLGLEITLWLGIGLVAWTLVTFWLRPKASLLALAVALLVAAVVAPLPGLLGWNTLGGLLFGLLLAAVCATLAAWQTTKRTRSQ